MNEKQSNNALTDATLAREVEDLLAIAPSVEFLAHVRTQLAEEKRLLDVGAMGPRRRWWTGRLPAPTGIAIATMVAAALVLVVLHRPQRDTPHQAAAVAAPAVAPQQSPVKNPVPKSAESEEIVTGFFSLMADPPPFERGLLVRMTVPASTMRAVGLPVGDDHLSDPVQADLLVGQDDLARAIRFVSYRKFRE